MKLTEIDKLKYWLDSELTILHCMFAIIMLQLTHGALPTIVWGLYLIISIGYTLSRAAFLSSQDKDYIKLPKK